MENTTVLLNVLLKKNYDVLKQYKKIAESAKCLELNRFFNQKVNERYVFGNQIKAEINQLNGNLFDKDQLENLNISKWSNLPMTSRNVVALLKACEQGEKKCLKEYKAHLKNKSLPETTQALLQSHYNQIFSTLWNLQFKILEYRIEKYTSVLASKPPIFSY